MWDASPHPAAAPAAGGHLTFAVRQVFACPKADLHAGPLHLQKAWRSFTKTVKPHLLAGGSPEAAGAPAWSGGTGGAPLLRALPPAQLSVACPRGRAGSPAHGGRVLVVEQLPPAQHARRRHSAEHHPGRSNGAGERALMPRVPAVRTAEEQG